MYNEERRKEKKKKIDKIMIAALRDLCYTTFIKLSTFFFHYFNNNNYYFCILDKKVKTN